jgi:hypothetical protein
MNGSRLRLRKVESIVKDHAPLYPNVEIPEMAFDEWDDRYDDMEQGEPIEEHDQVTPHEISPKGAILNIKIEADSFNFDEQIKKIHNDIKKLGKVEVVKIMNREDLKKNKKLKVEKEVEEVHAKKRVDQLIKQGKLVTSERTKRKIQLED